jgi:hypothetical protein
LLPGFFPGVGSYPVQHRLVFLLLDLVFFAGIRIPENGSHLTPEFGAGYR